MQKMNPDVQARVMAFQAGRSRRRRPSRASVSSDTGGSDSFSFGSSGSEEESAGESYGEFNEFSGEFTGESIGESGLESTGSTGESTGGKLSRHSSLLARHRSAENTAEKTQLRADRARTQYLEKFSRLKSGMDLGKLTRGPSQSGKPRRTLSERRGMKLDLSSLGKEGEQEDHAHARAESAHSSPLPGCAAFEVGDTAGKPGGKNLSGSGGNGSSAKSSRSGTGTGTGSSTGSSPHGRFAPFAEYVDMKTGALKFAGKASVHSRGIDFSNGRSFRISMQDLEKLGELGRGNYGIVWKVLHKPSGIIMAMKEVRLELKAAKLRQILMELEVLQSCRSECIVEFYGAFFVEGAVYMCMEYMQGGSLDNIYHDGVPEAALRHIARQVVIGLRQLKENHQIIHRDVKPTNILVNDQGDVKLCDFGVSGNLVASVAKTNIGCQSYMAPERICSNKAPYSVQSDVWSLGLSLLEIALGRYPYPSDLYSNIFSQLSAIIDGNPPQLPSRFSEPARRFVASCLRKRPEDRPTYTQLLGDPWLQKDDGGREVLAKLVKASNCPASKQKSQQNGLARAKTSPGRKERIRERRR